MSGQKAMVFVACNLQLSLLLVRSALGDVQWNCYRGTNGSPLAAYHADSNWWRAHELW